MKAKLVSLLAQANIKISDQQIQQLINLVNLLNKWNKAYNLTSVRDPQEMLVKHILDSLVVSPYLQGDRFIDVVQGLVCLVYLWQLLILPNNLSSLIA